MRPNRDVQAARIDAERAQNEAQTYANRIVPEARGNDDEHLLDEIEPAGGNNIASAP
jgi:hypothetical protein